MNVPVGFESYAIKPMESWAYEIQEGDVITQMQQCIFHICFPSKEVHTFVAHGKVEPGDYIVYRGHRDIYHCSRELFHRRHVLH